MNRLGQLGVHVEALSSTGWWQRISHKQTLQFTLIADFIRGGVFFRVSVMVLVRRTVILHSIGSILEIAASTSNVEISRRNCINCSDNLNLFMYSVISL